MDNRAHQQENLQPRWNAPQHHALQGITQLSYTSTLLHTMLWIWPPWKRMPTVYNYILTGDVYERPTRTSTLRTGSERLFELKVGQWVYLSTENLKCLQLARDKRLHQRWIGLYVILEKSALEFGFDVLRHWRIVNRFDIDRLKPCLDKSLPDMEIEVDEDGTVQVIHEVEYILSHRLRGRGDKRVMVTRTRPEATLMVNILVQKQNAPTNKDAKPANRLIQYLKRTNVISLTYNSRNQLHVDDDALHCFVDAAYADDVSRRSRVAYLIFLGTQLIKWTSILTSIIALSSTEAEYMALTEMDNSVRQLLMLFADLGVSISDAHYYCDAQSAIKLVQRQSTMQHTKHIDVRYHYMRIICERHGSHQVARVCSVAWQLPISISGNAAALVSIGSLFFTKRLKVVVGICVREFMALR